MEFMQHYHYKKLSLYTDVAIQEYKETHLELTLEGYQRWLHTQTEQNPKPLSYYQDTSVMTQDGYPRDDFLISLFESKWELPFDDLMQLICRAWNTFGDILQPKNENGTYTFVTGGWSGNEHVIHALTHNLALWAHLKIEVEGSLYRISERCGKKC